MFDFKEATKNIDGWLTEDEGLFLYRIAKKIKAENAIVEIGSWKGKSTICLGNGSKEGNGAKVFAIDPHTGSSEHRKKLGKVDTFEEFERNTKKAGIAEFISPVRDTSENAAKNFSRQIEFVFIDGAHEFSFVKLDFKSWFPRVINGGILAFHDSWHFVGVNLVTAIILLTSSEVRNPRLVDSITYFKKVERNSLFDRLKNIIFVVYRTLFGVRGFLKLEC